MLKKWEVNIEIEVITEEDDFDLKCEIDDCLQTITGEVNVVDIDIASII